MAERRVLAFVSRAWPTMSVASTMLMMVSRTNLYCSFGRPCAQQEDTLQLRKEPSSAGQSRPSFFPEVVYLVSWQQGFQTQNVMTFWSRLPDGVPGNAR